MITVICPSRGRPANAERLTKSFMLTKSHSSTQMIIAVDSSDSTLDGYADVINNGERAGMFLLNVAAERRNMVQTLNQAATYEASDDHVGILGFVGDDHLFETQGWDEMLIDALEPNMIAYGDDGHQGANLPTAVFMDANIVRTLGWMAPPGFRHLFVDNAWRALGERLGTLRYLPDLRVTHLHPHAGRAEWDATYAEANSPETDSHDRWEFDRWLSAEHNGLPSALWKLQHAGEKWPTLKEGE